MATQPSANEHSSLLPSRGDGEVVQQETFLSAAQYGATTQDAVIQDDAEQPQASPPKVSVRQIAPDLLRGLLMVLQALDHSAVNTAAWQHGTGNVPETPGQPITAWNELVPFIARNLTNLCGAGFAVLLGTGLAFFANSRAAQGWSLSRQLHHLSIRAIAILLVQYAFFFPSFFASPPIWLLNIVLTALAFDYFIAGILLLCLNRSVEPTISRLFQKIRGQKGWGNTAAVQEGDDVQPENDAVLQQRKGDSLAWHVCNVLLLVLAAVSLWGNVWSSPTKGHCLPEPAPAGPFPSSGHGLLFDVLFLPVMRPDVGIISVFPPMAWLPFGIFGLLYGRLLLAKKWGRSALFGINASLALAFALLFVSTRVFQYGNLSEDCLRTPEQAHVLQNTNQYLNGWHSFFYASKYPPSPSFAFLTLSGNFLLLALFGLVPSGSPGIVTRLLLNYGTNALFFYLVHLWVLRPIGAILALTPLVHPVRWDENVLGTGYGWTFWITYTFLLAFMTVACRLYARFKASKGPDSLWRFL